VFDDLKRRFSRFLQRRRGLQHFGRHPLVDTLAANGPAQAISANLGNRLMQISHEDPQAAITRLESDPSGLTAPESAARLARNGPNDVAHEKPLPAWLHLWHCYKNPFNLLLTVLAALSWLTQDAKATIVIGAMVLLSTVIRFVQEGRSNRAAASLKAMVSNTATVLRRPAGPAPQARAAEAAPAPRLEVPLRNLVVGDIVALSAGDMVPADCRLLASRDLFIAQSAMTGESLPVEKFFDRHDSAVGPLEQPNLVFMGTNVVSGSATAVVAATGNDTYFGNLANRVTAADLAPNAFQAGINSVSWLLIRFAAVMVPIVLLANGLTKGDWLEAFLFALSVAVGLTPEMLPMIVTSTLARGAVRLSRQKVIVKRLDAIQSFGAMDILCTDKTGTLTQDKVALGRHIDAFGQPSVEVLNFAFLNSHYQTGLKNLLDHAVLDHVDLKDELICKGAVEEVLAICTHVRANEAAASRDTLLDATLLARAQAVTRELNQQGLRVVAVAMKELPTRQTTYSVADESGLTLIGYLAFLDPPKESAAAAAGAEPALRLLANRHPVRQRRRGTGRQAAEVEPRRHRPFHALLRADQLLVRSRNLRGDVVGVRREDDCPAEPLPVGLVRRRPADTDADRPHDPHAQTALHPEPCRCAADDDDGGDHGRRDLAANGAAGRLLQAGAAADRVLRMACQLPRRLRPVDHPHEALLRPPLWVAVNEENACIRPASRLLGTPSTTHLEIRP